MTEAGGNPKPGLLTDLDHDPILDLLDGNGHGGLPAGLRPYARSDLDGKFVCLSNSLGLQIAAVKFRHEGMCNIVWFYVPVQDSSFHFLDYNPFMNGDDTSSCFMYINVYVMKMIWFKPIGFILIGFVIGVAMLFLPRQVQAEEKGQSGVTATVIYTEPINVRGGPSTVYYPIVGRVFPGDVLPALGVSPGREWVQVAYPDAPSGVGWLYATYVSISGGDLKVVEPPPTQTPVATATINSTFAAAFIFQPTSTRKPTFTAPPPLTVVQYSDEVVERPSGLSSGLIVIGLFVISGFAFLMSQVINRQ